MDGIDVLHAVSGCLGQSEAGTRTLRLTSVRTMTACAALATVAMLNGLAATVRAQDRLQQASRSEAFDDSTEDGSDASVTAAREALFDALARDVEQLEKQSNVLKKVVQLVSPTV